MDFGGVLFGKKDDSDDDGLLLLSCFKGIIEVLIKKLASKKVFKKVNSYFIRIFFVIVVVLIF